MKKSKSKLVVNVETIRNLTVDEHGQVVGGAMSGSSILPSVHYECGSSADCGWTSAGPRCNSYHC